MITIAIVCPVVGGLLMLGAAAAVSAIQTFYNTF